MKPWLLLIPLGALVVLLMGTAIGGDTSVTGGSFSAKQVAASPSDAGFLWNEPDELAEPGTSTFSLQVNNSTIPSGTGLLSDTLSATYLGSMGAPTVSCDARDVSGTSFVCDTGGTLTSTGSGTEPAGAQRAPFVEALAKGVYYAGAKYHAGGNSLADPGTNDFVVELVYTGVASGTPHVVSNRGASGGGWTFILNAGTANFQVSDGSATVTAAAGTMVDGALYHTICFFDESSTTGERCATNAVLSAAVNPTSIGSITSGSIPFTIGAQADGTDLYTGTVYAVREWECAACLDPTNYQAIARERVSKLMGLYPVSAAGQYEPTSMARNSIAYVDIEQDSDGIRRYFKYGANLPRVSRRKEVYGEQYFSGYLSEAVATNLLLQSQTMATTWSGTSGTVTENQSDAPDGTTTGDAFEATDAAGDVAHCISQNGTVTSAFYTVSVFAKVGAVTHAYIENDTIGSGKAWFDVSNCEIESREANVSATMAESFGNGWCRLSMIFPGTAAAHTFNICGATSDGDSSYDDGTNSTVDFYLWQGQLELGDTSTSPIVTTTGTVQRVADDLRYSGTSNAPSTTGTMQTLFMSPGPIDYTWAAARGVAVPKNSTTHYILGYVNNASVNGSSTVQTSGATVATLSGNAESRLGTGTIATLVTQYDTNNFKLAVNGVVEATDTAGTGPGPFTEILIGSSFFSTTQLNGLIGRVRFLNVAATTSPVTTYEAVALGDSITDGLGNVPTYSQYAQTGLLHGTYNMKNIAVSGATTTDIYNDQWLAQVTGNGYDIMFIMGGTNDITGAGDAVDIHSRLDTMYDAAQAEGMYVVCLLITPKAGVVGWNAAKQTDLDAVNALITANTSCDWVVDTYTLLEDPGNPDHLLATYDNGDDIHLSVAGQQAVGLQLISEQIGIPP